MIYQLCVQFGREYRVTMAEELESMLHDLQLKADWLSNCHLLHSVNPQGPSALHASVLLNPFAADQIFVQKINKSVTF